MDVRQYYKKLREIEAAIPGPFVVVTSLENADGGKAGVVSEVTRELAAKLMVEGRAVIATGVEEEEFFAHHAAQKKAIEKAEMAKRVQVTIISDPETGAFSATKVSGNETTKK